MQCPKRIERATCMYYYMHVADHHQRGLLANHYHTRNTCPVGPLPGRVACTSEPLQYQEYLSCWTITRAQLWLSTRIRIFSTPDTPPLAKGGDAIYNTILKVLFLAALRALSLVHFLTNWSISQSRQAHSTEPSTQKVWARTCASFGSRCFPAFQNDRQRLWIVSLIISH